MRPKPTLFVEREDADGYYTEEIPLPTRVEVCWRCDGRGTHDAWEGGMTSEEMYEQGPDFFEDYMAGHYSVRCSECGGRNVLDVVDEERLSPEHRTLWHAQLEDEANYQAIREMERRMGA